MHTHTHIKMFGMRAAFLDYAHYSTPIDGENLLSIDDKWTSYHGKSTVICCNDKHATQRYNSGIFNFIQHAGLSSVTSIWQHSSSSLFPSLYPSLRPCSLVSSHLQVFLHMKAPLCSSPLPHLAFSRFCGVEYSCSGCPPIMIWAGVEPLVICLLIQDDGT